VVGGARERQGEAGGGRGREWERVGGSGRECYGEGLLPWEGLSLMLIF